MGNSVFDTFVNTDARFKGLEHDIGLRLISEELEYKIDYTKKKLEQDVRGIYDPKEELALLAHLIYKIGYIRFKKPLEVKATLKNLDSEIASIYKGMRFSDGADIYYSDTNINLNINEEAEVKFICKNVYKKTHAITDATLFYHIETNTSYKDFVGAKITKNGDPLKYSQNFIEWGADYSYEIDGNKNVKIVIMLNNENGRSIQLGDELEVIIETAPDTKIPPDGLMVIEDGYELVIEDNITIENGYIPPMSIQEMKDYIKYGRQNIGDLVLNEDYRQFILRNIGGIDEVKVWQEREETKQNGWSVSNINKIFVSAVATQETKDAIKNLIEEYIYGKEVVFNSPVINDILINAIISTKQSIPSTAIKNIKQLLSGYYDGIHKKMSKESIYTLVFQELLKEIDDFALDIQLSQIQDYKNENFYKVDYDNIVIQVTSD